MDTKLRSEVRTPQAEVAELRSEDRKLRLVIRWLIVAIAVLSVAVVTLGAALIVESGSDEAAPTPTTLAEPTAGGEVWSEDMLMSAGFERADRNQVRHVDRGLEAFGKGDWEHFACGGSDCGGSLRPALYYYDRAQGWRSFGNVFETVGSSDIERTSPVVVLAETPASGASGSWGSWTVAFSVRAGADEQLWIQHWEEPWGEWLQEMWVI